MQFEMSEKKLLNFLFFFGFLDNLKKIIIILEYYFVPFKYFTEFLRVLKSRISKIGDLFEAVIYYSFFFNLLYYFLKYLSSFPITFQFSLILLTVFLLFQKKIYYLYPLIFTQKCIMKIQ